MWPTSTYIISAISVSTLSGLSAVTRIQSRHLQIGPKASLSRHRRKSFQYSAGSTEEQLSDPWGLANLLGDLGSLVTASPKWWTLKHNAQWLWKQIQSCNAVQISSQLTLHVLLCFLSVFLLCLWMAVWHIQLARIGTAPRLAGTISGTGGWRKPNLVIYSSSAQISFKSTSNQPPFRILSVGMLMFSLCVLFARQIKCGKKHIQPIVDGHHHRIRLKALERRENMRKHDTTSPANAKLVQKVTLHQTSSLASLGLQWLQWAV